MNKSALSLRLLYSLIFPAFALMVFFVHLLPLGLRNGGLPEPDWLFAFAAVWIVRRPDFMPVVLIALIFFLADLIYMRPLGLWAGICFIALEFLRSRVPVFRELPFAAEFITISLVMSVAFISELFVKTLLGIQHFGFGATATSLFLTLALYPLFVLLSGWAFGIRKISPGEVDEHGRPL